MKNYRAVVLESPCLQWQKKETQHFFSKIVDLKINGFQYEYGKHVMPLSSYDFIATHLLLCEDKGGELIPVSAAKIARYSLCEYYHHSFQPVDLALRGGNPGLSIEIERLLKKTIQEGREITYDSSWTVRDDLRHEAASRILRIMLSLWINYHLENSIPDFIVSATLKVKTDKIFMASGCQPITANPFYRLIEVDNQKAMMLQSSRFSKLILDNAKRYRELWNDRLVFDAGLN